MTPQQLKSFEDWFASFVEKYSSENPQHQQVYDLKIQHTYRVKEAIESITKELGLSANERRLAQTMALFHDTGRFPQFEKYNTFKDATSENHAALSVKELQKQDVLKCLSSHEQELILSAIYHHNMASLPDELTGEMRFYTQLLRDADKVDIFYTVTNYYEKKHEVQNKTIELDLDDANDISEHILRSFLNGEVILMEELKEANDFKLLQLAWVNDLNFSPSLDLIIKGKYLWKIINTLPLGEKKDKVSHYIQQVLNSKMARA